MKPQPKKIGTLTLPLHSNYGGLLQAYALQLYLKRRGHEVLVIDRKFNKRFTGPMVQLLKRAVFPSKWKQEKESKIISKHTDYFIEHYITPKTKPYYSSERLKNVVSKYNLDALIVGSDQVWRVDYTNAMAKDFFYEFAKGDVVKRLSYAASFGKGDWEQSKSFTKDIKELLKQFDGVSVREDSGKELCENYFDTPATRHVDPTMLLNKEDYVSIAQKENEPKKEGNILVYMLDIKEDRQKVIDAVIADKGGKTYSINKPVVKPGMTVEEKIYPTVTSWIQGFIDAEYVVTDSFHGTIFSLLFNKPFIVYGNQERGLTRFYSMLKTVGLAHRVILNSDELTPELLKEDIDWDVVNKELQTQRINADTYFKEFDI